MRSKTKLRSFTLALFSLLLVLLIAVPSKLTAQAVTVPGDDDVYYDEGIFGITKYRYDHNTKTIYLSHAKEQSLYLTSGQRFLSSVYIHEAEHLVVDSNFDTLYDKDYNQIYNEPSFDALDKISETRSNICDVTVNKVDGEFEHCIVRDKVLFFVDKDTVDGAYVFVKRLVYYPPEKQDKSFTVKSDEDLSQIKEGIWGSGFAYIENSEHIDVADHTNIMQQNKYLEEINVEENSIFDYISIDGAVYKTFTHDNGTPGQALFFCPNARKKALHIPEGTTGINKYACFGCKDIPELTLPSTLKFINECAFVACSSVEELTIPRMPELDGYGSIVSDADAVQAFDYLTGLKKLTFDNYSIETVSGGERDLFNHCYSLEEVVLNDSIPSIYNSFNDCPKLKKITLPKNLSQIWRSFNDCTSLKTLDIDDNCRRIEGFNNCASLEKVEFPSDTVVIGGFEGCASLKEVVIPEKVLLLDALSFSGCSELERAVINSPLLFYPGVAETASDIYNRSHFYDMWRGQFTDCPKLQRIEVTDNNPSIFEKEGILYQRNTPAFEITDLPEGNPGTVYSKNENKESAYYVPYEDRINLVFYPLSDTRSNLDLSGENVYEIGEKTFYGNNNLKSIKLPKVLHRIGNEAFRYCSGLTEITIPEYCVLGTASFADCENLKRYEFEYTSDSYYTMMIRQDIYIDRLADNPIGTAAIGFYTDPSIDLNDGLVKNAEEILQLSRAKSGITICAYRFVNVKTDQAVWDNEAAYYDHVNDFFYDQCRDVYGKWSWTFEDKATGDVYKNNFIDHRGFKNEGPLLATTPTYQYESQFGLPFSSYIYKGNEFDTYKNKFDDSGAILGIYGVSFIPEYKEHFDGNTQIRLPYKDKNVKVYKIEDNGSLSEMQTIQADNYTIFNVYTPHDEDTPSYVGYPKGTQEVSYMGYSCGDFIVAKSSAKSSQPYVYPEDKKPHIPEDICGDLDGDGDITANDALTILRTSVGMETITPEQIALADVDGDGDITANDALDVLRYSVGMGNGGYVGKEIA